MSSLCFHVQAERVYLGETETYFLYNTVKCRENKLAIFRKRLLYKTLQFAIPTLPTVITTSTNSRRRIFLPNHPRQSYHLRQQFRHPMCHRAARHSARCTLRNAVYDDAIFEKEEGEVKARPCRCLFEVGRTQHERLWELLLLLLLLLGFHHFVLMMMVMAAVAVCYEDLVTCWDSRSIQVHTCVHTSP